MDREVGDDVGHHGHGRHTAGYLRGIELVEGVAVAVVVPEVPAAVHVQLHPGHAGFHQWCDVGGGLSATRCTPAMPTESSSDATCLTTLAAASEPAKVYPLGLKTPLSDSIASTCFGDLGGVRVAVGAAAASAVLLVGPEHHANRPPRPEAKPLHQTHGLPRGHGAAAVVHRALSHVPRVDVSAEDHDLVGFLAAARPRRRRCATARRAACCALMLSVTITFSPRFWMRWSIIASSTLSAAAGIFTTVES